MVIFYVWLAKQKKRKTNPKIHPPPRPLLTPFQTNKKVLLLNTSYPTRLFEIRPPIFSLMKWVLLNFKNFHLDLLAIIFFLFKKEKLLLFHYFWVKKNNLSTLFSYFSEEKKQDINLDCAQAKKRRRIRSEYANSCWKMSYYYIPFIPYNYYPLWVFGPMMTIIHLLLPVLHV